MDSSGRLHMPLPSGEEFVGETFEETGLNRHERRKLEAEERRLRKIAGLKTMMFGTELPTNPEPELMPTLEDLE